MQATWSALNDDPDNSPSQSVRWSRTMARSGRLKNVRGIFQPPEVAKPTTRKKYRVRFQVAEKARAPAKVRRRQHLQVDDFEAALGSSHGAIARDNTTRGLAAPVTEDNRFPLCSPVDASTAQVDLSSQSQESRDTESSNYSMLPGLDSSWPLQLEDPLPLIPVREITDSPPCDAAALLELPSPTSAAPTDDTFDRYSSSSNDDLYFLPSIRSRQSTPAAITDSEEDQPPVSFVRSSIHRQDANHSGPAIQIPCSSPLIISPTSNRVSSTDASRYYQLYIQSALPRFTPLWLTVDNPFISSVIPASMQFPILQHALFALTGYWASRSCTSKTEDSVKALWHKQKVLVLFRESLAAGDCASLPNLLACLFIQSIEIVDSGIGDWALWLQGIIMMLQGRDRLEADMVEASDWQVFTKCAVAMETMAAVTSWRPITISSAYWRAFLGDLSMYYHVRRGGEMTVHRLCSEDQFFQKILGCPTIVLFVLCEIERYVASAPCGGGSVDETRVDNDNDNNCRFNAWEDLLVRWTPPADSSETLMNISEAYRNAALVHYSRRVRRLPYRHATVQQYIVRTLHHLKEFDYRMSSVNVIWPLMIASLELDIFERPELKQRTLEILEDFPPGVNRLVLFENCAELLRLVWDHRRKSELRGEEPLDWRDISKEVGWVWSFW